MSFTAVEGHRKHRGFGSATHTLSDVCDDFSDKIREAGLEFGDQHSDLVRSFVVSLATKGFVIFSGLSGAGKTRLALAMGQWFGPRQLHVEAVRPDWSSPEALLGFENLNSESMDARLAWTVPRSLEFIMEAARNRSQPYLLLLEEMNLAHVEQYFADVLSGMESDMPIVPNLTNLGGMWRMPLEGERYLPWPKNLFLVGTVNMDETTYTFSPKVLDRASTLEFRVPPGSFRSEVQRLRRVEKGDQDLVATFLHRSVKEEPAWDGAEKMSGVLEALHAALYEHDFEFGYRVYTEALRFGALMADAGQHDHRVALDYLLLQKVLPKLNGSGRELGDVLEVLGSFAFFENADVEEFDVLNPPEQAPALPVSFAKIQRITRKLRKTDKVTFSA